MGNMESHQMVRYGICVFQIFAGLGCFWFIPSGKHTKNYGTSPFLMGKLTISMAIFNSKLLVYQRVTPVLHSLHLPAPHLVVRRSAARCKWPPWHRDAEWSSAEHLPSGSIVLEPGRGTTKCGLTVYPDSLITLYIHIQSQHLPVIIGLLYIYHICTYL